MHNKAQRFAKLLVDEIKLYKGSLVERGRQEHTLYALLRDDIDKSRATYQRRFGALVPERDYFNEEMLHILANDDSSLMGDGFPG